MDKIKIILFYVILFIIFMAFRILRLPIAEIFISIFILLMLFLIGSHLKGWKKAKRLGFAEKKSGNQAPCIIAFTAFGLIFIGVGLFLLQKELRFKELCSSPAIGVVVDYKERFGRKSTSYVYNAVVEFNAGVERIRAVSRFGVNDKQYDINEEVRIYYNPLKPGQFRIKGETNPAPLFFITFGSLFSVVFTILILTPYDGKAMRESESGSEPV